MTNFGIDLLLESQKANIRSESDILVIFMHWMLCKKNLRNVGIGDNVSAYSLILCNILMKLNIMFDFRKSSIRKIAVANCYLSAGTTLKEKHTLYDMH